MSEIPAPLLSRRTATVVAATTLVGSAAAVAPVVAPVEGWLFVVVHLLLALQAGVLALAVFVVWRTLVRPSWRTALAAVAAMAGFLLLAVVLLGRLLLGTPWGVPAVRAVLVAAVAAGILIALGLIVLGAAVLRSRVWHGATRPTLVVAGLLAVALVVAGLLGVPLGLPYAAASLLMLGLVAGLRSRRSVPNARVPQAQMGAAEV